MPPSQSSWKKIEPQTLLVASTIVAIAGAVMIGVAFALYVKAMQGGVPTSSRTATLTEENVSSESMPKGETPTYAATSSLESLVSPTPLPVLTGEPTFPAASLASSAPGDNEPH